MRGTTAERFWDKVEQSPGCWLWKAYRNANGYGTLGVGGRKGTVSLAHRVSWELHYGTIPDGMDVLHTCDVPSCIRPDHLFLGTQLDNMKDMVAKGRRGQTGPKVGSNIDRSHQVGKCQKLLKKITIEQFHQLKSEIGTMSQEKLAKKYGIDQATVSKIKLGKTGQGL